MSGERRDLQAEIEELEWYHTIELAPGVVTPGWLDHRPILNKVPFPPSLAGMRCLDVGTFDGFWAFEMERRGASEVIAIDILDPNQWEWPLDSEPETIAAIGKRKGRGDGFTIAARELGSLVKRVERSVYDLDEAEVGTFDLIYLGSLLIHLRDPVKAVERLRAVCRGAMIVLDGIDLLLSLVFPRRPVATLDARGRPWWWTANEAGLTRQVEAGGFNVIDGPHRIYIPPGAGHPRANFRPKLLATRQGRYALVVSKRGDPHAVLMARPRSTH